MFIYMKSDVIMNIISTGITVLLEITEKITYL